MSFKVRDVDRFVIFCGGLHITSGELRYWEEFDYQLGDIEVCMFVETCRDGTRRNGPGPKVLAVIGQLQADDIRTAW